MILRANAQSTFNNDALDPNFLTNVIMFDSILSSLIMIPPSKHEARDGAQYPSHYNLKGK